MTAAKVYKDRPIKIINLKLVDDNEDVAGLVGGEAKARRGRERGFAGTALTSGGVVAADSKTSDSKQDDKPSGVDNEQQNNDAAQ